jgi:hypothetical protein
VEGFGLRFAVVEMPVWHRPSHWYVFDQETHRVVYIVDDEALARSFARHANREPEVLTNERHT